VVALDIPPLRERTGDIIPLAQHFAKVYGEQNGLTDIEISPAAQDKLIGCYWKGNVRELENTVHRAILMMGTSPTMELEHIVISPMSLKMMETDEAEGEEYPTPSQSVNAANRAARMYGSASGGFGSGVGANDAPSAPENMVGKTVQEVERDLILNTLNYCQGNRTQAADLLGISIRTLRNKLKEYEGDGSKVAPAQKSGQSASSSAR